LTIRLNTSPTERTPWPGFQSYLPDITRASPVNLSESVPASFPKAACIPAGCPCACATAPPERPQACTLRTESESSSCGTPLRHLKRLVLFVTTNAGLNAAFFLLPCASEPASRFQHRRAARLRRPPDSCVLGDASMPLQTR